MKLFDDIDDACDFAVETNRPHKIGILTGATNGKLFKVYPSRIYESKGMFFGISGCEKWNEKTKKWEIAK